MLNVIIVDDEPLVRITLNSIIDWNRYDLNVVGEAESGKQCLEILEKQKVDVIITDIKMPVIDGLELIDIVKNKYPHILIIVLSAYDEFGLVKKALMSGAEDYILKSDISEKSTMNALIKVREKYEQNRKKTQYNIDSENNMIENSNLIKGSFFKDLLLSPIELEEDMIKEKIEQYKIDFNNQNIVMIIIMIKDNKINKTVLENVVKNFINELLKHESDFYCLISDKRELTLLKSFHDRISESKLNQDIIELVNNIKNSIKKFLDIDITIGVSKPFNSFSKLNEIYIKTKKLLEYIFFIGNNDILLEQEFIDKGHTVNIECINELSKKFKDRIEKLEFFEAKNILHNITIESIEHFSNDNYRAVKFFYCKLLTAIVDKSIDLSLYNRIFIENMSPYDYLLNSITIYQIEDYLLELIDDLQTASGIEYKIQYGDTIGKVINYVQKNYNTDINLNKIANELNFNPSYLSTKFKQMTKKTFNEYLNSIRIENAKKMMAERKHKLYKISSMVGYTDQKYFCKIFKKIVGMTPREYMK